MEGALDDIRFLASSANRVRVLDALTDGPATRRDLQEATGTARSTAARVLNEAEARGWVSSEGSRYRITPVGAAMLSAFTACAETTEGIGRLGEAIGWLPEPARTLDPRYLRDARITTPAEGNPTAPLDRGEELICAADEYRGLTRNSLPRYMEAIRDLVGRDRLDFEGVVEAGFVEVLRDDPERAALWDGVADRTRLYDGDVPINMHLVDGAVLIWLCDENGAGDDVVVKGLLESEHPRVVSWAESYYEEYREAADPLDPATLPER